MNRMDMFRRSDVDPADAAASAGYGRLSAAVDAALEEAAFVSDAAAAGPPPPPVGAGPASVMDAAARAVIAAARAQRLAGAVVGDAWPTALWAAAEAQQAAQADAGPGAHGASMTARATAGTTAWPIRRIRRRAAMHKPDDSGVSIARRSSVSLRMRAQPSLTGRRRRRRRRRAQRAIRRAPDAR